ADTAPAAGTSPAADTAARGAASAGTAPAASFPAAKAAVSARPGRRGAEALAQDVGMGLERLVGRLVRFLHPPREGGIIPIVEGEPGAERVPQTLDRGQCAVGRPHPGGAVGTPRLRAIPAGGLALEGPPRIVDRLGQLIQVPGGLLPVHGPELA